MGIVVNLSRTKVTHPGGTITPARFVFHNNRAAVWTENRNTRVATRHLFAEGATLDKPRTARLPILVHTSDGQTWEIRQERGGCGCRSVLKSIPLSTLLDPEVSLVQ